MTELRFIVVVVELSLFPSIIIIHVLIQLIPMNQKNITLLTFGGTQPQLMTSCTGGCVP